MVTFWNRMKQKTPWNMFLVLVHWLSSNTFECKVEAFVQYPYRHTDVPCVILTFHVLKELTRNQTFSPKVKKGFRNGQSHYTSCKSYVTRWNAITHPQPHHTPNFYISQWDGTEDGQQHFLCFLYFQVPFFGEIFLLSYLIWLPPSIHHILS